MNGQILSAIMNSNGSPEKPGSSNQNQPAQSVDYPVVAIDRIKKISDSYTRILMYKVSKEAHQRYSVRLNVIESLREFTRISGNYGNLPIFKDAEKSYNLLLRIMKKYLTEEALHNCDNVDNHIQVAEILQNCLAKNKSTMRCFERVIERILVLEQTEKSKKFLQELITRSDELKVDTCLVEKIYKSQGSWLIDKPLSDYFHQYCSTENKEQFVPDMALLFEKIIDNPSLFELVAVQLKDIFVETEYSQEAQDFIQKILEGIQTHCNKYHKDTLDLYPAHLQFCVILLRIKPVHHSEKSRNHTVKSLKEIFLKSLTDALILVSHFPDWLPEYLKFFDILEEKFSQDQEFTQDQEFSQDQDFSQGQDFSQDQECDEPMSQD